MTSIILKYLFFLFLKIKKQTAFFFNGLTLFDHSLKTIEMKKLIIVALLFIGIISIDQGKKEMRKRIMPELKRELIALL